MLGDIQLQSEGLESLKTLYNNYKKDGSSRKTAEYLTKRLLSLENQWFDFEERHNRLIKEEDKTHKYYTEGVYEKTKTMWDEMKRDILTRLQSQQLDPSQEQGSNQQGQVPILPGPSSGQLQNTNNGNVQELLNKQDRNFRALNRAFLKINIDQINDKWELEDHFNTLKSKWADIDKLHWELDGTCTDPAYYRIFNNAEQQYDDMKKKIMQKINSNIHFQHSAPKIELPVFTGDYALWISFKDLFLQTVDKNTTLSKAQKMQHLKSKLRGEAEKLVKHLHVNSENYEACWELLTHRYDNRRLLFTSFANTMLTLPIIQQPNAFNLKKMHDTILECLNGLDNIGLETSTWSPMIAHLMSLKLDAATYAEYIKDLENPRELPNIEELCLFLENKFIAFESMRNRQKENTSFSQQSSDRTKPSDSSNKSNYNKFIGKYNKFENNKNYHVTYGRCPLCEGSHVLMQCGKFLAMDLDKRNDIAAKLQVCKNCLYSHGQNKCTSTKTCLECKLPHHTLLHTGKSNKSSDHSRPAQPSSSKNFNINHASSTSLEILLATALIQVKTYDDKYITLRALIDQGSQVNLISETAAQLLKLSRTKVAATVSGVGAISGNCRGALKLQCKAVDTDYTFNTSALIMSKFLNPLPTKSFDHQPTWEHLQHLKLADPTYNISRGVDILLGAEIYSDIILSGVIKGDIQSPIAQQTKIGWILCGSTGKTETFSCNVTLVNTDELTRFWESEDILPSKDDISDDDYCESYYKETTKRHEDGKYIVKMPMLPNYEEKLGNSKHIAISQLIQLNKRLSRNHVLNTRYNEFIDEYINLGHMKQSTSYDVTQCFLPHHGVLREHSTTTKLRVVFNASQKTTSGYSLNELMYKGPNLQKDIQELLIKWRTYQHVFTADIEKHYRSIWLSEDQQSLQKIMWNTSNARFTARSASEYPTLQEMKLKTVTYGTKCAPWLAMRTLLQLAIDDGHKYPQAAEILKNNFYVDDLLGGHSSLEAAKQLRDDLVNLLKGGGMNLRKWSSNNKEILQGLSEDQISTIPLDFTHEDSTKTITRPITKLSPLPTNDDEKKTFHLQLTSASHCANPNRTNSTY